MPKPEPSSALAVEGVDAFALRWMASLTSNEGTVFSPAGMWPLLAILADVATDEARAGLEAAIVPGSGTAVAPQALTNAAFALLSYLERMDGVAVRSGIWVANKVSLRPEFVTSVPPGTVEVLSGDLEADRAAIKEWADAVLGGLLSVDIGLQADVTAYLASAITANTRWKERFKRAPDGRLERRWYDEGTVLTSEYVTTVRITGSPRDLFEQPSSLPGGLGAHHVYLAVGNEGEGPGVVLAKGLAAIRGGIEPLTYKSVLEAAEPPLAGPGLTIEVKDVVQGTTTPMVQITTPSFRVTATTQLHPEVCGLPTLWTSTGNDFPGIAKDPMAFAEARQQAVAEFTSLGFSAGALSEVRMFGNAWNATTKGVFLTVNVDRPFGFLAVEPDSGLLLFAGWVNENELTFEDPYPSPEPDLSWLRKQR